MYTLCFSPCQSPQATMPERIEKYGAVAKGQHEVKHQKGSILNIKRQCHRPQKVQGQQALADGGPFQFAHHVLAFDAVLFFV